MDVTEDWLAKEEEADRDGSFRGRREEGEGVARVGAGPDAEERVDKEDREGVDWSLFLGEEAEEWPSGGLVGVVGVGMLEIGIGGRARDTLLETEQREFEQWIGCWMGQSRAAKRVVGKRSRRNAIDDVAPRQAMKQREEGPIDAMELQVE
eukprot:jgi/Psemu1/34640/gm1.34640_g